jgi:hypothetical protein
VNSRSLIAFSPILERALVGAASALALVLAFLAARRGRGMMAHDFETPMPRRTELVLLGVILAFGTLVRTVGWDDQITPVFYASEVPQLHVGKMLDSGAFWATWTQLLHTYQAAWPHESAIVMPVYVLLQRLLGPSFGLPVLVGAVFGVAAIVLAWLLGRATRSQAFGLLFAAFVACSPLQVSWSRLGGHYIAASPHVLLALLCGYVAGRRRSIVWTLVAGLVAWVSLYHYYAARVAIPLAGAAIVRGCQDARASWMRRIVLATLFVATIASVFHELAPGGLRQAFWPSYPDYVGNRGEQSLSELVTRDVEYVRQQGRETVSRYFFRTRSGPSVTWAWGLEHGGLCLAPIGVLGGVGLIAALWGFRRGWLWLAVLAAGIALTSLSTPSARRFQVMDLAWCALAAHGLLALARILGRGVSYRVAATIVGGVSGAIALWSAMVVFALGDALPHGKWQPIPFGESGFMDGLACRRCAEAAKEWQREIADGAFVVLFDSDIFRENRTSPGGLPAYGKIAALAAGAPERFIDGYALIGDWDIEPPSPGPLYGKGRTNPADFLRKRIERSTPTRIVWHFERPTPWEGWLVRRLVAAGGEARVFWTPLAAAGAPFGIEVVTPWDARDAALAVIRDLASGSTGPESKCVGLAPRGITEAPVPAFLLAAPAAAGVDRPPPWLTGGYGEVRFGNARWDLRRPIGAAVDEIGDHGARLDVIEQSGTRTLIDVPSGQRRQELLPFKIHYGLDCAARIGEHWWVVDALSGSLHTTYPDTAWVPRAPWMGITRGPDGELILVAADQNVFVLDVETRREIARFPATVSPSRRVDTDECSLVAAGRGWIATLDSLESVLSVYDPQGRPLGTRRLDALVAPHVNGIGAAGQYLGVGAETQVKSLEVTIDPSCLAGSGGG